MLVTFDWAEAFAALNLCAKPILDRFLLVELADAAQRRGDPAFGEIAYSLGEDARWHLAWSRALVDLAVRARPSNAGVLRGWVDTWFPMAEEAAIALGRAVDCSEGAARAVAHARTWLRDSGVSA
jgi:toluene monooxygenase system protein E